MKVLSAVAASVAALALPLVAASPATAMEIKKDDNCLTYVPPSFSWNSGDPQVDEGSAAVNNCITVTP